MTIYSLFFYSHSLSFIIFILFYSGMVQAPRNKTQDNDPFFILFILVDPSTGFVHVYTNSFCHYAIVHLRSKNDILFFIPFIHIHSIYSISLICILVFCQHHRITGMAIYSFIILFSFALFCVSASFFIFILGREHHCFRAATSHSAACRHRMDPLLRDRYSQGPPNPRRTP